MINYAYTRPHKAEYLKRRENAQFPKEELSKNG